MDREQAKEAIRRNVSCRDYLKKSKSGMYICPFCGSGEGNNGKHTGALKLYDTNTWTCFACEKSGDVLDLYQKATGADYNTALSLLANEAGVLIDLNHDKKDFAKDKKKDPAEASPTAAPATDYTEYYKERMEHIGECDYLKKRGISAETAKRFMLGYDPAWRHPKAPKAVPTTPRLIIPTSKGSYLARDTRADLDDQGQQYAKSKVGSVRLYNTASLYREQKALFITEGEIDALSIIEAGGEALGLGSAGNYRKLVSMIENKKPAATLVLCLDNDPKGKETTGELKAELDRLGVSYTVPDMYGSAKDANEALIRDRDALKRAVEEAKIEAEATEEEEYMQYIQTSVFNHMEQFRQNIKDSEKADFFPTGFSRLDRILDGGLYSGLYIVGAITSLGKTTFCLQVCDQIAAAGNDVIIFSLEMSRDELMAKSISRHSYLEAIENYGGVTTTAKTTRGILTGSRWKRYGKEDMATLEAAMKNYSDYASKVFIHEGVGSIGVEKIKEVVGKHIRLTGKRPVVLIDYLQILAPYDPRSSDKQNTDKAVLELKRLSRDKDIPIIGISSFNRDNYTAPVNNASFKESGAIEYSSDVLIGLQYYGMDYQKGEGEAKRRTRVNELLNKVKTDGKAGRSQSIQVKILKNRNGAKGDLTLDYFPMFNYYRDKVAQSAAEGSGSESVEVPEEEYTQGSIFDEAWKKATKQEVEFLEQ